MSTFAELAQLLGPTGALTVIACAALWRALGARYQAEIDHLRAQLERAQTETEKTRAELGRAHATFQRALERYAETMSDHANTVLQRLRPPSNPPPANETSKTGSRTRGSGA